MDEAADAAAAADVGEGDGETVTATAAPAEQQRGSSGTGEDVNGANTQGEDIGGLEDTFAALIDFDAKAKWKWAINKVIENRYVEVLKKRPKHSRANARIGMLYRNTGRFDEAIAPLSRACQRKPTEKLFRALAQCHMEMYEQTHEAKHLEGAFNALQAAMNRMEMGMWVVLEMPRSLHQLGRIYEEYGAYESALDMYGKVIEMFPSYSKYSEVMYRTSMIMKHLSTLSGAPTQELLQRTIDMCEFLLEVPTEAVPEDVVVVLYARSCMNSERRGDKAKAATAMKSVFDKAKRTVEDATTGAEEQGETDASAEAAGDPLHVGEFDNVEDWLQSYETWLRLGRQQKAAGEELLAVECFETYADNVLDSVEDGDTAALQKLLPSENLMEIATSFANVHDYESAVRYAEGALDMDHFNTEIRACLSKWSADYAALFEREQKAAETIKSRWKGRVWSKSTRDRYHDLVVQEWEDRLMRNRFDLEARRSLAYFAKLRWRGVFMYEEHCAAKIQRTFRALKDKRRWQAAQRAHHLAVASDLYYQYRKSPYDLALRQKIRDEAEHKFAARGHICCRLPQIFDKQAQDVLVLQRVCRSFVARRMFKRTLKKKRRMDQLKLMQQQNRSALRIQTAWRRVVLARMKRKFERTASGLPPLDHFNDEEDGDDNGESGSQDQEIDGEQLKQPLDQTPGDEVRVSDQGDRVLNDIGEQVVPAEPTDAYPLEKGTESAQIAPHSSPPPLPPTGSMQGKQRDDGVRQPPTPTEDAVTDALEATDGATRVCSVAEAETPPATAGTDGAGSQVSTAVAVASAINVDSSEAKSSVPAPSQDVELPDTDWLPVLQVEEPYTRRLRLMMRSAALGDLASFAVGGAPWRLSDEVGWLSSAPAVQTVAPKGGTLSASARAFRDGAATSQLFSRTQPVMQSARRKLLPVLKPALILVTPTGWGLGERDEVVASVFGSAYATHASMKYERPDCTYKPAGLDFSSEQFVAALRRPCVYWDGATVTAANAVDAELTPEVGDSPSTFDAPDEPRSGAAAGTKQKKDRKQSQKRKRQKRRAQVQQQQFDGPDCFMLASVLQHYACEVRALALREADLSDDNSVRGLCAGLAKNRSLQTVSLAGCNMSLDSVRTVFETCTSQNFKLCELRLENNMIAQAVGAGPAPGDAIGAFATTMLCDYFATHLGRLTVLSLHAVAMGPSGARDLAEALEHNAVLTSLTLSSNRIRDAGCIALLRALKVNQALRHLDLASNGIGSNDNEGDDGGAATRPLGVEVCHNRSLTHLSLAGNALTENAAPSILRLLYSNIALVVLDLTENQFPQSTVQELLTAADDASFLVERRDPRPNGPWCLAI